MLVVAEQLALPNAGEAFAEDGSLKEPAHATMLDGLAARVVQVARALRA